MQAPPQPPAVPILPGEADTARALHVTLHALWTAVSPDSTAGAPAADALGNAVPNASAAAGSATAEQLDQRSRRCLQVDALCQEAPMQLKRRPATAALPSSDYALGRCTEPWFLLLRAD